MALSGRFVAIRKEDGDEALVELVDALGTAPRESIAAPGLEDFCCFTDSLWIARGGRLFRHALTDLEEVEELDLGGAGGRLRAPGWGVGELALWLGEPAQIVCRGESGLEATAVGDEIAGGFAVPLSQARLAVVRGRELSLFDLRRGPLAAAALPGGGEVTDGAALFGGKALVFATDGGDDASLDVVRPTGTLVHHIEVPRPERLAIASNRGVAVIASGGKLIAIDLRYGHQVREVDAPVEVAGLAIDAEARYVAVAGRQSDDGRFAVLHIHYTDLFGGRARMVSERPQNGAAADARAEDDDTAEPEAPTPEPEPDEVEAAEPEPAPVIIPSGPLRALRPATFRPTSLVAPPGVPPYERPEQHIDDLLDLLTARVGMAICEAWDSGRLSTPNENERPYQTEVLAILGQRRGGAGDLFNEVKARSEELAATVGARARATLAGGGRLPLLDIANQFALDPVATQVLTAVAAPSLRGEIARLYGILANDVARPLCDRYLVETLLCTTLEVSRAEVAAALDHDATLIRHGLVKVAPGAGGQELFAALGVDPVLLSRLRGRPLARVSADSITTIESAARPLEALTIPEAVKRDAVAAFLSPPRNGRPVRMVVSGRPGSGRTALVAALADRAGMPISVIEADRLPRQQLGGGLRAEIQRAALRGTLPLVSGLDFVEDGGEQIEDAIRDVLRGHPGPLAVRATPERRPPLDPGYHLLRLPPLSEAERLEFWRRALARRGLRAGDIEELASRFRVGPGTIETVIDEVVAHLDPGDRHRDLSAELDRAARQHIDARLGQVATRIERRARWEQVALPADVLDSVREFIARIHHRRTVYDRWGFDKRLSTSRGLTALFYGPPGTGKTMVAGLIARELGLDLYRVDLARITSKWIGETEKNLAQVFDAAEDGQALILFDEADSLFTKRTEVRTSVDRYANLEVNYLLQRLDTFEGVAILTTNMEGSIDQAFKRRLSVRLAFPFPDEEMRVRLWAAHIPSEVPVSGDLDFETLAQRYPMSGGYIRNSTLRAAFLAAQEDEPLSHDHLVRAIELEYQEMGKLSKTSRME